MNPHTWHILEQSIKSFSHSIRIYMSATMNDVIDPIRYLEKKYAANTPGYVAQKSEYAYEFPRDYSNYDCYFFSKLDQIKDLIIEEEVAREKWLIFVTNRDKGKKLTQELNGNDEDSKVAMYIDSQSRKSTDLEEKVSWEIIKNKGKFDSRVLITTSVLDNGFSIKDKQIKNIVICTHDETEFLQELGRCRLAPGQEIRLHIQKLLPADHERRRLMYKRHLDLIFDYYGDIEEKDSSEKELKKKRKRAEMVH